MRSQYAFTITAEHVRDPRGTLGRQWFKLNEAIGRPQKIDIGKRVFECRRNDDATTFYQVENDEQRDARLKRGDTKLEDHHPHLMKYCPVTREIVNAYQHGGWDAVDVLVKERRW